LLYTIYIFDEKKAPKKGSVTIEKTTAGGGGLWKLIQYIFFLHDAKLHSAIDVCLENGDRVDVAEGLARVADVEESLVVVARELGEPGHQLVY